MVITYQISSFLGIAHFLFSRVFHIVISQHIFIKGIKEQTINLESLFYKLPLNNMQRLQTLRLQAPIELMLWLYYWNE